MLPHTLGRNRSLFCLLFIFRTVLGQCPVGYKSQVILDVAQRCNSAFGINCPAPFNCVDGWCCQIDANLFTPRPSDGKEGRFKIECPNGGKAFEIDGQPERCSATSECDIGYECTAIEGLIWSFCCANEETIANQKLKCPNQGYKYQEGEDDYRLCETSVDCPSGFVCVSNSSIDAATGVCCTQAYCPDNRVLYSNTQTIAVTCLQDNDQCPDDFFCEGINDKVHGYCCLEIPQAAQCELKPDHGTSCGKTEDRWYFDTKEDSCRKFQFRGCKGNANNFADFDSCRETCGGEKNKTKADELKTVTTAKPKTTKKPVTTDSKDESKETKTEKPTKKPTEKPAKNEKTKTTTTTTTRKPDSFIEASDGETGVHYGENPCPEKRDVLKTKEGLLKVCPVIGTPILCKKDYTCLMATRLGVGVCCKNK